MTGFEMLISTGRVRLNHGQGIETAWIRGLLVSSADIVDFGTERRPLISILPPA
jgi:hypothetical protein